MRPVIKSLTGARGKTPPKKLNRKAQRRRAAPPRWHRPALYAASFLVLFGSTAGGTYWAWTSGAIQHLAARTEAALVDATVKAGLSVNEILVEGRSETTRKQLLDAIGVQRHAPILTVDTEAIRHRLLALGWVADAVVQRRLPGILYVRIKERKAVAIWQHKGKFVLVDANGTVIGTQGLDRFTNLKIVVGDAAPQHATALLDMLASAPQLMQRVRSGVWVGDRRWNLQLDDGIDIRLPEVDPHLAWARLVKLDSERHLLSRNISAVDLRFRDRLVVQRRDPGKNT